MQPIPFTLDQLTTLDAIVRTGSFAGAAKELHRVPSAVTYLVKGLEDALRVTLFDRSGRRVVLTRTGEHVLELARSVLDAASALEGAAAKLAQGWEVELQVVVDGALPMASLSACLRRFADPAVPTTLRIDVEYQDGVADRVAGGADIALLVGLDWDGDEKGYDLRPLPPLEMVLVAASGHPVLSGPATESARAAHAELVVRDSSPRYEARSRPSFLGSRNVVFLPDFHAKRLALASGAGYGWIPKHFIEGELVRGSLALLEAEPNRWTYRPQLATPTGAVLGRGARLFIETLLGESA